MMTVPFRRKIRRWALVRRIRNNDEDLTEVDLVDARLSSSERTRLLDALDRNAVITTLWLSGNDLGDVGAADVVRSVRANGSLRHLILGANGIGPKGTESVANFLEEEDNRLEVLCLGGNDVGNDGASALGRALSANDSSLKELYLRNSIVGDVGAASLAKSLPKNTTLRDLWLCGNCITDEGARAFAAALEQNGTLRILDLSGNDIGDEGALALLEAMKRNHTIVKIDLEGNDLIRDGRTLSDIASLVEINAKQQGDAAGSSRVAELKRDYLLERPAASSG